MIKMNRTLYEKLLHSCTDSEKIGLAIFYDKAIGHADIDYIILCGNPEPLVTKRRNGQLAIVKCPECGEKQSSYDMFHLQDGKDYCYTCVVKWANLGQVTLRESK